MPIQRPQRQRLGDVPHFDLLLPAHIGDGARHRFVQSESEGAARLITAAGTKP